MNLKLGIIGHSRSITIINNIIDEYFKDITYDNIKFENINEVPIVIQSIKYQEDNFDALLFTGIIPYNIINSSMISSIPWVYIPTNETQLLTALLKASLINNYDIKKLSIDSYDRNEINKIYKNIGYNRENTNIFIAKMNIYNNSFIKDLENFHLTNYTNNNVSCCITGLSSVYKSLVEKNIPCIKLDPTLDIIKQTIQHLELKRESKINEKSQTVVISITIDPINEFSLINENEYQILLEKTKVTQKIYLFAQKIQATVIEVGLKQYLLFCTKSILETETQNFQNLSILSDVSKNTSTTISIGIGYGITVREAKYNAQKGMKKAINSNGNKAFIVYNKKVIGPIVSTEKKLENDTQLFIDEKYNLIASDTNISINTIFKLHCIIDETKKKTFTSLELANHLNITPRSMNRIINKLESNNYSKIIGKKVISKAGRPSRIIKLLF
ncbi:MAG: hypothetical protein U9N10_07680 [Bacillota bacterium]|nr:hypothetical protein [Bacillota bacterium]